MPETRIQFESTDRLAELIRRKRQVLLQLRDLGQREQSLSAGGDATALLQLAAAKQHLVTSLAMIERQLGPFRQEEPDSRVWRSPADRQACAAAADECRTLLAEVVALEQAHEQAIRTRRDAAAGQLREVNQAGRAAGAYRQFRADASPANPRVNSLHNHTTNSVDQLDISSGH